MIILKKTLWTVLMLLTSLAVCAQEPQTNEDVSPELRILTPKGNTAPSIVRNPRLLSLWNKYNLNKDGKRYKVEFDIDYYDQSPVLEKAAAKYFFKDTVSNTLLQAYQNYLDQFSKNRDKKNEYNSTYDLMYRFSIKECCDVGSLMNYTLVLEWEDHTGGTVKRSRKQWDLVYDIDDDKILGIDDVFTPIEAQKIKDVIGNRRLQMNYSSSELVYGYMEKGKLHKFTKRFQEVPEVFSDSFKERSRKVRLSSYESQTTIPKGEVLKAKEVISGDGNGVFDVVEQMPSFPGGQEALLHWLSRKIKYPKVAEQNGIQGRVIVSYVVEKDGSITDIRVVKSVDPSLDREAIRVVSSMPRWKPGMQKGKPVRVKYTVPVTFRLN